MTTLRHPWPNLQFLISDIRTLKMSEIKKGRVGLYGAEHSKCNHMMILGFKGLIDRLVRI